MAKRIQFSATGGRKSCNTLILHRSIRRRRSADREQGDRHQLHRHLCAQRAVRPAASLPSGLGTEAAGVVVKVGAGVSAIKPGDRVVYAQSSLGAYSEVHNVPEEKWRCCRTSALSRAPLLSSKG